MKVLRLVIYVVLSDEQMFFYFWLSKSILAFVCSKHCYKLVLVFYGRIFIFCFITNVCAEEVLVILDILIK